MEVRHRTEVGLGYERGEGEGYVYLALVSAQLHLRTQALTHSYPHCFQVCAFDGRRYVNECCAECAGSTVRAYCAVPLALATMPNANPKLCTMYCSEERI